LQRQLAEQRIVIDAQRPLFVYIPCGVGGAPGGITFGLRHAFGNSVHCFFAEPVGSPCVLVRLAALKNRPLTVREVGLDNQTEADGLAVAQASEFAARMMRTRVSGVFTVEEDDFFAGVYALERAMDLRIEPSAAASFGGPAWLLDSAQGRQYIDEQGLAACLRNSTHVLWTTGGAFVPGEEYQRFHERGRSVWRLRRGSDLGKLIEPRPRAP
jgi:D-serine dehydratase